MSVRRRLSIVLVGLASASGLAAASGCDDAFVDPFLRSEQPYSLYGLLVADVQPRIQRVRVQRIRSTVEPPSSIDDPRLALAGTVEAAGPVGGVPVWTRRLASYTDGTAGTVFEAEFQPSPETVIDLAYEDEGGRRVETTVRIPPVPSGSVDAPVDTTDAGARAVRQRVVWDADRLGDTVVVDYQGTDREGRIRAIQVAYGPEAIGEDGTTVEIDLLDDLLALYEEVQNLSLDGTIPNLSIRMIVLGLTDDLPDRDVIPTENLGRVYVQGGTAGRVVWSPTVVLFP